MHSTKSGAPPGPAAASCKIRSTTLPLLTPCGFTSTIDWPGTTCRAGGGAGAGAGAEQAGEAEHGGAHGGSSGARVVAVRCNPQTRSRVSPRSPEHCCTSPHPTPCMGALVSKGRRVKQLRGLPPPPSPCPPCLKSKGPPIDLKGSPPCPPRWARWRAPPPGGPAAPWPASCQSRGLRRGSATPARSPCSR